MPKIFPKRFSMIENGGYALSRRMALALPCFSGQGLCCLRWLQSLLR
jgi:hypothetical protein